MLKYTAFLIIGMVFFGCEEKPAEEDLVRDANGNIIEGTLVQRKKDGTIVSERIYKDGKLEGIAKTFNPNGELRTEVNYQRGIRQGIARRYYLGEKVYQEYHYEQGKLHGLQKKYYQNGNPMSEIEYRNDFPGVGLREFLSTGKPIDRKYRLLFSPENKIAINNTYILKVSLSPEAKRVDFFSGKLDDGFMHEGLNQLVNVKNNVLEIHFDIPPGYFLMKEIHLVAKVTTRLNNFYIVEGSYNLAIENRGAD